MIGSFQRSEASQKGRESFAKSSRILNKKYPNFKRKAPVLFRDKFQGYISKIVLSFSILPIVN